MHPLLKVMGLLPSIGQWAHALCAQDARDQPGRRDLDDERPAQLSVPTDPQSGRGPREGCRPRRPMLWTPLLPRR